MDVNPGSILAICSWNRNNNIHWIPWIRHLYEPSGPLQNKDRSHHTYNYDTLNMASSDLERIMNSLVGLCAIWSICLLLPMASSPWYHYSRSGIPDIDFNTMLCYVCLIYCRSDTPWNHHSSTHWLMCKGQGLRRSTSWVIPKLIFDRDSQFSEFIWGCYAMNSIKVCTHS